MIFNSVLIHSYLHRLIFITVTPANRNPYFNIVKIDSNSNVELAAKGRFHRRQDAPTLYDVTTVAYIAKPHFILNSTYMFDGNVRAVSIPRARAIDIDNIDFAHAELLLVVLTKSPYSSLING